VVNSIFAGSVILTPPVDRHSYQPKTCCTSDTCTRRTSVRFKSPLSHFFFRIARMGLVSIGCLGAN
jgi:hypothetical protein